MFNIFKKTYFLADYLEGFVDMHNHILPGIDDGAKTVEESLTMIKQFSEIGIKKFFATPHIMQNYYPNNAQSIGTALSSVQNELAKRDDLHEISIEAAAEHMIDADFDRILENGTVMPLKKSYLLVEMSYLQASINFEEAIQNIASARYFPILAHPERYVYISSSSGKYERYKEKGILFQLNMLSLSEYYGKDVQRKAFKLIDKGLIDYVATDAHNTNHIKALKEVRLSRKQLDKILPIIETTINSF